MSHLDEAFDVDSADRLGADGFVVLDGWLGDEHAHALHAELLSLRERGRFAPSRVGHGAKRRGAPDVRSDLVCWFDVDVDDDGDPGDDDDDDDGDDGDGDGRRGIRPGPQVRRFFSRLVGLRARLNATCFLSLTRIECHAACYETGAAYQAHLDAFAADDRRVISFSHYLNEGWTADDGGCLRMHGKAARDVEPVFDRLVIFQSRTMLHEVLPVSRRRFSSTGWMSAR